MHRIDGAGHVGNMFSGGTPGVTQATNVTPDIMNAIQEEIANTIEDLGGTLNKADNTQLVTQLVAVFGRLASSNTWTTTNTFNVDGAGWTAVPLNSGGNWSAPGDEVTVYQPKYRKDSFGRVWLRGQAIRTSGSSSQIGTLPAGYRPSASAGQFFAITGNTSGVVGIVQVAGNGVMSWTAGDPGGASDVNLDGIAFYADA